jgi:hypothetical protein
MLDPDVVETGVGVAQSDKTGYWYAVQMFGRPASASIEFSITNRADSAIEYVIGDRTFELPPRFTRTHTRCRKPQITLDLEAERPGTREIEPASGDRYVIVEQSGELQLRRQE